MKSLFRMKAPVLIPLLLLLITSTFYSCDSKKEELEIAPASDYFITLQKGKYITYRLDSTVFTQAGRQEEVHSYQEKHVVDEVITDGMGRPSYRIFRFLNNQNATGHWQPSGTYFITPLQRSVEVIEDNMRVVALVAPVREGESWKGNRYLVSNPYGTNYTFNVDDNMADWDFVIEETNGEETINGKKYTQVITVSHADESLNVPITDTKSYASRIFSMAQYSKNLGMIYQEHILWEYQPNPNGTPYRTGFGVKRSVIDHN